MRLVIDTNVIISAALSPNGNPAKVISYLAADGAELFYCAAILAEYEKVLAYPRLKIPQDIQAEILEALIAVGTPMVPFCSDILMQDESDRVFYDTAKTSSAYLITGNKKHYPDEQFIKTPTEMLAQLRGE